MKFITTPIYYVNAEPHIGGAYTTLAADVVARFWRLKGDETFFLTGTDEHGAKIAEAAEKAGKEPQAFTDEIAATFESAWKSLNIQPDGFIRTTNPQHKAYVQTFLQKLYDQGAIYKGEYKGWYCTGCEEFKTETQIGPNNNCPIHLKPLTEVAEETYLFKLSEYGDRIVQAIKSGEFTIEPESRKNEVLSFIESEPLRDVAISRKNVAWGVTVPWDENHTVYVWVDALLNYLSACESDGPEFRSGKRPVWPATLQLVGKDILRFHAVIWPGLLLAAGLELPKTLFVHGFFTLNGHKISKSLGNTISPAELIDKYGVDGARYLLLTAVPFGSDGDISLERFYAVYSSELANNLGNLVSRTQTMLEKYRDGVVPTVEHSYPLLNDFSNFEKGFAELNFELALEPIRHVLVRLNQFIDQTKPWALAKEEDKARELDQVLANLAENIYRVAVLLLPFVPETAEKILGLFGTSAGEVNYATLGEKMHVAGVKIQPIEPLFPRLES